MWNRRAGAGTRAIAFDRRLVFLQRNRIRLLVLVGGYLVLFGAIGGLLIPRSGWLSGAYWGGSLVGLLWALSWFASLDGSLFVRAGGWAEQWTSEVLRKKARSFYQIDDFPLEGRNLDHVLVGSGGVFAVETKWKSKWKDLRRSRSVSTCVTGWWTSWIGWKSWVKIVSAGQSASAEHVRP